MQHISGLESNSKFFTVSFMGFLELSVKLIFYNNTLYVLQHYSIFLHKSLYKQRSHITNCTKHKSKINMKKENLVSKPKLNVPILNVTPYIKI